MIEKIKVQTQEDKHRFETVSLVTVDKGQLDVTLIPAVNQPDWVVPSALVIHVGECLEHTQHYEWKKQKIAVHALLPENQQPDKVIILEGIDDKHRLGLITKGGLRQQQIKISNAKDIAMADCIEDFTDIELVSQLSQEQEKINELSFIFQTTQIEKIVYSVPDLEILSDYLIKRGV